MATQDDLAALFYRNLSLHHDPYVPPPQEVVEDVKEPSPEPEPAYVYSITQHYHHSNHLVSQQQPSRPASEPPQTDQLTTEIILSRHGVDASTLIPAQLDLFKSADATQQMRLVELWRICPFPSYTGLKQDTGSWTTTLEQEEAMAKLRYEQQMLEERLSRVQDRTMDTEDTMSDDSTAPLTPIQGGDGRWMSSHHSAEPYMSSGYEMMAAREYEQSARPKDVYSHFGTAVGGSQYNHATDPVYKSGGDWHVQQQQEAMENQYGAYAQNLHTGWAGVAVGHHGEDEEML
ncbi:hypothetical protein BP5796_10698 [Coleophoma crateriformis]|uniref:Uncharacterized protein n=1 Tax=Coleophoma crateriformis TaxID=565419 RepID=A0A3D8QQV1_9HELO|nr:hypothetical protein BP5796_10698 [Coleophoma crateriformis]